MASAPPRTGHNLYQGNCTSQPRRGLCTRVMYEVHKEGAATDNDTGHVPMSCTAAAGPEVRASVATITSLVGRGPLMLSPVVPFHRPGSALRFLDNGGPEPTPPCKHRWVTATLAQAGREGVAYKADVTEGAPRESGTSTEGTCWREARQS